jgi:RHS repeat-associated protein
VHSGTTTNYTYDAAGNRTAESTGATVSATYNGANELTSYDNSAADTTAASYNGNGLRMSAATTPTGGGSTTQHFVWNTTTSVPELLMDHTNAYIYGPNGMPFEQVNLSAGTINYLVSDALGSVRGFVSSGGSLSASTSYDAWGNPETSGGLSSYTPIGFAGGYTDPTGLEYLVNRYYDPTTGQFLNVDPMVKQTGQPFSYSGDDPVNAKDPTGLTSEGYCFNVTGSVLFGAGTVQVCAVEVGGNKQVGVTVTEGGGFGFNTAQILNTVDSPASLTKLFSVNGSLDYQRSNANKICSLGGDFSNSTATANLALVSGTYTHFTGSNGIHGTEVGGGVGWNGIKSVAGAGTSIVETTTEVFVLNGDAKTIVADIIETLNFTNTLHWTGLPGD